MDNSNTTGNLSILMQIFFGVSMLLGGLQGVQADQTQSQITPFISQQVIQTEDVAQKLPEPIPQVQDEQTVLNLRDTMSDLLEPGMVAIEQRYIALARKYGNEQQSEQQQQADPATGKLIEDRLAKGLFKRAEHIGMSIDGSVILGLRKEFAMTDRGDLVLLDIDSH